MRVCGCTCCGMLVPAHVLGAAIYLAMPCADQDSSNCDSRPQAYPEGSGQLQRQHVRLKGDEVQGVGRQVHIPQHPLILQDAVTHMRPVGHPECRNIVCGPLLPAHDWQAELSQVMLT